MKIKTRTITLTVDEPTLNELVPLAGASVHGMYHLSGRSLSEGASAIRDAITSVDLDPMPDEVGMDILQQRRIRPPEDLPGAYVINTAATMPGKPPLEYLYRSIQVNKVRSRYIVCRILIAADELAEAAGPATSPEDDAGRLLLQASLLLRRTPPNSAKRFADAEVQPAILAYIGEYLGEHGYPPSHQDMANHIGTNRSVIHRHLVLMQKQGLVSMDTRKARTVRVLRSES